MNDDQLPLITVTLKTEEGKKLTSVQVPKYPIAPAAIVWSDRVFQRKSRSQYWECFGYVVPDTAPNNPTPATIYQ